MGESDFVLQGVVLFHTIYDRVEILLFWSIKGNREYSCVNKFSENFYLI